MGKCDEANVEMNMGDSASPMKPDIFTFTVPPEAPVFEPTPEEFLDPLAYINKIKPIAEKSGICKIKPPPEWQPPFAVDVDKLRFTPRIQRLNELEAITRVKLNFLDQMIKFWDLQGSILKIPIVERKPLDLYSLHKIVQEAGGFELCTSERKWSKVAVRLGHPQGKGIGSILKSHYERILYPYDVFKTGGQRNFGDTKVDVKREGEGTPEKRTRSSTAANTPPPAPRRYPPPRTPVKHEDNPEGSRADTALPADVKEIKEEDTKRTNVSKRYAMSMGSCGSKSRLTRSSKLREHRQNNMSVSVTPAPNDPLAKYMCHVCGRGDIEEQMLLCDGCDDSYHTFCLVPPLADVPKGDWRCPVCVAEEVSKPTEAFGFEQAQREYTLQQFGEMADQFKSDYFNMPVHMVPTSTVEKEFWRVVSSIDEDVAVEYGADLHSMDHGSGFPTKGSPNLYPGEQEYAESSWNLNNLPVLEGSILGHINCDISGMKIPWMYVGMCFSTFCWHNEDHWSYSINYLHWGEPKTWYGVPGNKAEQFEETMKCNAPELFQWQPDLLHQLVTIMNPNILMKAGVPVYRTDQNAGEFVITFPRAYHAGFNQGYNFAEAVNFTPADWLKVGRECIAHYSTLRRQCVFSHDELVCKMSLEADNLGLGVAVAAYRDMRTMLTEERKLRKSILEWGVTEAEREAFELLADDARQCVACNTTCFLSAVTCKCSNRLACLKHYDQVCCSSKKCTPGAHVLRFRYTLDELPVMLDKLKRKADEYREWADAVQNALDPHTPKTCDLEGLKALLKRAHELKIQKTELVRALETGVEDAEKCATVIQQLDLNKMRTRTRHRDTQHDPKYRLTLEELTLFCEEIDGLACVLPEGSAVKELLRQTSEFERRAQAQLSMGLRGEAGASGAGGVSGALREVEECCELGARLCIRLPMLPALQARLAQLRWLDEVAKARRDWESLSPDAIQKLIDNGQTVPPHPLIEETSAQLHELGKKAAQWEKKAKAVLIETNSTTLHNHSTLTELDQLLNEAEDLECALPSLHTLTLAVTHAKDWLSRVEEMQAKDSYPYFNSLEALVKKGQSIPLSLYEKDHLASAVVSAREWKEGTAQIFLKKNWAYSLMEALSPRTDILSAVTGAGGAGGGTARARKGPPVTDPPPSSLEAGLFLRNFSEDSTATEIVAAFKHAEERELKNMKELRARNMRKEVRAPAQPGVTFCVCGKRQYGLMVQCELCKEWYHGACAQPMQAEGARSPSPPRAHSPRPPLSPLHPAAKKFLCGECVRTRRPRLERILQLLVWLQRLPVRLAEGEALQCVTERAMAWQDAARAVLASPHLAHALAMATAHHPPSDTDTGGKGKSLAASEHAYSAAPRSGYATNSVRLPTGMLFKLEELMMEGDLLEVTLDEQEHLWAVVSAARPAHHSQYTVSSAGTAAAAAAAQHRHKRRLARARPHKPLKRTKHAAPHHHQIPRKEIPSAAGSGGAGGSSATSATTTNYLNRRGRGAAHAQPLMMRKHYLARHERKKRQMQNRMQRNPGTAGASRRQKGGRGSRGGASSTRERPAHDESTSSSGEEEDDCAAKPCLRPTGKEVDWVQCDGGCEGWFHMHCVGVRKTALREDDEYHCANCKRARPPPS